MKTQTTTDKLASALANMRAQLTTQVRVGSADYWAWKYRGVVQDADWALEEYNEEKARAFCWFVEARADVCFDGWFTQPAKGNGGWITTDPLEAKRYTKEEAEAVCAALNYFGTPFRHTKWVSTEHEFVAPTPELRVARGYLPWIMNDKFNKMIAPYREEICRSFPRFAQRQDVIAMFGQIAFESDRQFAIEEVTRFGRADSLPTWGELSPFTKLRWERIGTNIANCLIEKCPDQLDAIRGKAIEVPCLPVSSI